MRDSFFIRFYQIGNDHVSARFLARFLAIRFGQGFSVRSLLNPIKRDLRLTKKLAARYFFRVKSRALSLLKSRRVSFSRLELLFALAQKFEKKFYQKLRCR